MRILITGSRRWLDRSAVENVIKDCLHRAQAEGEILVVRHGKCPTGADNLASKVVRDYRKAGVLSIVEEERPAKWQHPNCDHPKGSRRDGGWYCRAAGPLRNQEMVDEGGIDEVHAWPLRGTTGTQDCMRRADLAGLPIFNHGDPL